MSKTKEKKKRTTGFKLGLAQAIMYLIAAVIIIIMPVVMMLATAADTASFVNVAVGGGIGVDSIDWDNDGRYETQLWSNGYWDEDAESEYEGKLFAKVLVDEREEVWYQEWDVDKTNPHYKHIREYEYYDFVSENMQDKEWTFENRKTGELVKINFTQVQGYERYLEWAEEYAIETWLYCLMFAVGGFTVVIAILQFIATFKGGKSYHANNLGIAMNAILVGFGLVGLIGAIKDRKLALSTDEKYLARKHAKEQKRLEKIEREKAENGGSTFTGGAFANAGINLLTGFVCLITLGLAYPAMVCWKLRWKCSHTFVSGRQLVFDGKGIQFFGKYLLWLFLSVITLGIYYIVCMKVALAKWQTKHTHFADTVIAEESENLSVFDGHWYQLLGVNWLCNFVTAITLSFGRYWAHCYRERWFCKHKTIDGVSLTFDGKAVQYFGKCVLWWLLTVVTLGIYSFWRAVKTEKWTCSHTHIKENENSKDFS